MRYTASHKEETRRKLLASSRALAKRGGFEGSGVDALMGAIGLSGGAFYGHFPSKQALFQALIEEEMAHSSALLAGDAEAAASGSDLAAMRQCLRAYLSRAHAAKPEEGCALPALGPEIARASPELRAVVEQALKRIQKNWAARSGDADLGWALLAQCVGAQMLARMVEGERCRGEILASSRRFVEQVLDDRAP